jgi:hypothetical protein
MECQLANTHLRRGNVVVMAALSLTVLVAFAAIGVDLSFIHNLHGEMQRSTDASALAGASGLEAGQTTVLNRAYAYAAANPVHQSPVTSTEATVTTGNWDGLTRSFVPNAYAGPIVPNAVRVNAQRENIPLFFGPVLNQGATRVEKEAIAVIGGGQCLGIWGLEGIGGNGDILTDSYNSDEGIYGSAGIYPNGDLCSCQGIVLHGEVNIHGDTMYAEGYNLTLTGNAYDIWGNVGEHRCGTAVPQFDINAAAASNDNDSIGLTDLERNPFRHGPWDLRLGGSDNLTLHPGIYYFTSATVAGEATITITGPTQIYVSGDAAFAGDGFVNVNQDPHDLLIYSTGSTLTVTGTNGFCGAVIAPTTEVILPGTGEFWGTILGRTVEIGGTATVHVDESLVQSLFGLDPVAPALVK